MRNFRKLDVYHRTLAFTNQIFELTKSWTSREKYILANQLQRASVSVPSNIAEGSSRRTSRDFARFIEISLGSAFEIETQLSIAKNQNYVTDSSFNDLIEELSIIQKQLNSVRNSII